VFSLADSPYAALSTTEVMGFLQGGRRLPRPPLAPEGLYQRALQPCWHLDASYRPVFSELEEECAAAQSLADRTPIGAQPMDTDYYEANFTFESSAGSVPSVRFDPHGYIDDGPDDDDGHRALRLASNGQYDPGRGREAPALRLTADGQYHQFAALPGAVAPMEHIKETGI
jgi:hypothetical protein